MKLWNFRRSRNSTPSRCLSASVVNPAIVAAVATRRARGGGLAVAGEPSTARATAPYFFNEPNLSWQRLMDRNYPFTVP
jgi:hypothetical protein